MILVTLISAGLASSGINGNINFVAKNQFNRFHNYYVVTFLEASLGSLLPEHPCIS